LEELLEKFNANTAFLGAAASSSIADDALVLDRLADIHGFMARLGWPKAAKSAA
jgi:hypothetical protein